MTDTTTNKKAVGAINTNVLHTDTIKANFGTDAATNQVNDGKAITTQLERLELTGHVIRKGSASDFARRFGVK